MGGKLSVLVFTAASKITTLWDIPPCSRATMALMEAVCTSVTSVNFNESTRFYIPESCHLPKKIQFHFIFLGMRNSETKEGFRSDTYRVLGRSSYSLLLEIRFCLSRCLSRAEVHTYIGIETAGTFI
jgi:hypothetical protein